VRTVDRSERVRTYNFPENRISDHRVGYKAYNLDQVLDGDLDAPPGCCAPAGGSASSTPTSRERAARAGPGARRLHRRRGPPRPGRPPAVHHRPPVDG
jgi:hypothetical protein